MGGATSVMTATGRVQSVDWYHRLDGTLQWRSLFRNLKGGGVTFSSTQILAYFFALKISTIFFISTGGQAQPPISEYAPGMLWLAASYNFPRIILYTNNTVLIKAARLVQVLQYFWEVLSWL